MITIFDLLRVITPLLLAVAGAVFGSHVGGNIGLAAGALLGGISGLFLGRMPWLLTIRSTRRELSRRTTADLLADLREHRSFIPNFLLHELASRGHDISAELPVVFEMLASEHFHRRTRGWAAMLSAFPGVARQLQTYSPAHGVEECRHDVERIRNSLQAQNASSNATGA